MKTRFGLDALLKQDAQADRIVPPSGFTVQLVTVAAAAMAFLAVFALALSIASGRLADRWGEELGQSVTILISATGQQQADQTTRTLQILETTTGVAFARALDPSEQADLLAPWLGEIADIGALPVPQLIEVIEEDGGMDVEGLKLRLAAEVPTATLDDHAQWRAPLVRAADRLRMLGWISFGLVFLTMTAMVTLAANAALAANGQVIGVLRLVGAKDDFIARAFIRRFTLRAMAGAAGGMIIGLAAVRLLPSTGDPAGILTGLRFQGVEWMMPLLIPALAAIVAFGATRWAANRALERVT